MLQAEQTDSGTQTDSGAQIDSGTQTDSGRSVVVTSIVAVAVKTIVFEAVPATAAAAAEVLSALPGALEEAVPTTARVAASEAASVAGAAAEPMLRSLLRGATPPPLSPLPP